MHAHTDITFGFLVGEQSHMLLCQPGVIDWTKMYNSIVCELMRVFQFICKYLIYSGQGVHCRIFDEIPFLIQNMDAYLPFY